MKKNRNLMLSVLVAGVAIASNLQWSYQDYGLKTISLSKQVLAQDSNSDSKETGLLDKVTDWLYEYDDEKVFSGETRKRKATTGGTLSGGISDITHDVSGSITVETTTEQIEYYNKCKAGKDRIFCSDGWEETKGTYKGH